MGAGIVAATAQESENHMQKTFQALQAMRVLAVDVWSKLRR